MTNSPIEIETGLYHGSHGHSPKGKSAWEFLVINAKSQVGEIGSFFVPSKMTFSDAKVWAKAYVRFKYGAELKKGDIFLEVAP